MGISQSRIGVIGLLFAVTFLTGLVLTRGKKPYNVVLVAVHKLLSVAALALLAISTVQANNVASMNSGELAAAAATVLLFAGTIATGALVSTERAMPAFVVTLHRVTPFLTIVAALALLLQR